MHELTEDYKGNNVECPICQGKYEGFRNFGQPSRPNALCPGCGSLERHRLLWLYLKNRTNFFSGELKVIHFAPEKVLQNKFKLVGNIQYTSADLYSPLADLKTDITNIQCRDNSFDVVFCYHVLEHIPNDKKAMQELLRVMNKTGWAIIQVPLKLDLEKTFEDQNITSPEDRLAVFGQSDHVRIYGRDYRQRLIDAGFNVKVDNYASTFNLEEAEKYGIKRNEDIYFCTKSI